MGGPNPSMATVDLEPPEDFDLAELDGLLSYYDGFFTGIAVGPETIPPSEWLPLILGDDPPLAHGPEAEAATGLLLIRYNELAETIEGGTFEPVLEEGPDGELDGAAWAEGFTEAMSLRPEAWGPLISSKRDRSLLAPIVLLLAGEDLELDPDDDLAAIREEAVENIPECVFEIDEFWRRRGRRNPVASAASPAPKVGRNEPCPCGSGKKFKKCCGT